MMNDSTGIDRTDSWIARDDLALAEQALKDRRAAEKLLIRVMPRVRYAIRVLMRGDRDSDDVLSQTMLEILESLGNFQGKGSLEAWAGKIAFHTVTGHTKRRGMIERVMTPDINDMGVSRSTPEQETARGRIRTRVTAALDKLPEERRETLVLRLVFGHSIAEIAGLTDVPVNTVRSRLRTGLRELRRGVAMERDYLVAK